MIVVAAVVIVVVVLFSCLWVAVLTQTITDFTITL